MKMVQRIGFQCSLAIGLFVVLAAKDAVALEPAPRIIARELGEAPNVHQCGKLFLAGQPERSDIQKLQSEGITHIISVRMPGELTWNADEVWKQAGFRYSKVPIQGPDSLTDEAIDEVRRCIRESPDGRTLLHCGSATRVSAVWFAYRVLDQGVDVPQALAEAHRVSRNFRVFESRALDYVQRMQATQVTKDPATANPANQGQQSVRPGINDNFLDPNLDLKEWLARFEVESREVYAARNQVLAACKIKPGDQVADVGAGTGIYTRIFSSAVGGQGSVFAIDISPKFIEHIRDRARAEQLTNVTPMLTDGTSIPLADESIDVAFICDTYHHFEFPQTTLQSIYKSLRSGGTLVVIDFDRIPGKTREWLLDHVRADKATFRTEIEQAGFAFAEEVEIDGFEENYLLRFTKP